MIKPPSFIKDYSLIFSGDPALELPPLAADDATDEIKTAAIEARINALTTARETGNWPIKPGEVPTVFHFAADPGLGRDYFHAEIERALARKKPLAVHEAAVLVFRITLKSIDNAGPFKLEFEEVDGYRLVSRAFVEKIYAIGREGRALVNELGALAYERMVNPIPFV